VSPTTIEWTDDTWNPVTGCTKVSPGCDNCYAEGIARRFAGTDAFPRGFEVTLHPERLDAPLRWRKPRRVFVNSMSDLFHDTVPDDFIVEVWAVMAMTPQHTYQVLTKRHGRMRALLGDEAFHGHVAGAATRLAQQHGRLPGFAGRTALPNVWLGVSVEDQKRANLRIPALLDTPAAVRFLSCEPLLGPVDLTRVASGLRDDMVFDVVGERYGVPGQWQASLGSRVDWVIVGGESGPGARPMHPDWARQLRDQCQAARVPFFFKQWGEHLPVAVFDAPTFVGGRAFRDPRGGTTAAVIRERGSSFRTGVVRPMRSGDVNGHGQMLDDDVLAVRVGKKKAGRKLDGRTWDESPTAVSA
jgi:protein gp37